MKAWKVVSGIALFSTLFFVVWIFVKTMTPNDDFAPKFFTTPSGDFVSAYIDRQHKQISVLGLSYPFQTADYDGNNKHFTFVVTNTDGNSIDGHYADGVLHLFQGTDMLLLQSSSPKDLMKDVADTYKTNTAKKAIQVR